MDPLHQTARQVIKLLGIKHLMFDIDRSEPFHMVSFNDKGTVPDLPMEIIHAILDRSRPADVILACTSSKRIFYYLIKYPLKIEEFVLDFHMPYVWMKNNNSPLTWWQLNSINEIVEIADILCLIFKGNFEVSIRDTDIHILSNKPWLSKVKYLKYNNHATVNLPDHKEETIEQFLPMFPNLESLTVDSDSRDSW